VTPTPLYAKINTAGEVYNNFIFNYTFPPHNIMNKEQIAVRGFYIFSGFIIGLVVEGIINNIIIMKLLSMLIK
jgi:hypothetical protein